MPKQPLQTSNPQQMWAIALPLIISNISTPMLGLVDTAIMGHLSDASYLGAIALGSLIFNFIFWSFGFLRMGTTGIAAQAFGQQDYDEIRAVFGRALFIALIIACAIVLVQQPINLLSFHIIDSSAIIEQRASEYFNIRIWSTPATLCNYVLIGILLAMQNAKAPLIMVVITNVCNIILDLVFVLWLNMEITGIALATVIAEYLGLLIGLFLLTKQFRLYPGNWFRHQILDQLAIKKLLFINQNIFIRTLCLMFTFAFFTVQSAKFGELILAANTILLNFQMFMAYALDGFAHATEALVGKAIGSRDRKLFKQTIKTACTWSFIVALLFTLTYGLFGRTIIDLLTNIETVRTSAYIYLPWLIAAPIISVWCYLLDGIFIGATLSREMRNTMLFSTVFCFLPAWYGFRALENHGLWLALLIFLAARGLSMLMIFKKTRINSLNT